MIFWKSYTKQAQDSCCPWLCDKLWPILPSLLKKESNKKRSREFMKHVSFVFVNSIVKQMAFHGNGVFGIQRAQLNLYLYRGLLAKP